MTSSPMQSTHLATSAAPPERTGTAAGVTETTSELGISLGIAAMGSLGGAVYRREIDGEIPGGVPRERRRRPRRPPPPR